jgi:hypothetical protein
MFKSLQGGFEPQLFNMISINFSLVLNKMMRENSLLYKNVTATYHRYKGFVQYHFLQCVWNCSISAGLHFIDLPWAQTRKEENKSPGHGSGKAASRATVTLVYWI